MKSVKSLMMLILVAVFVTAFSSSALAAWGTGEVDLEQSGVTLARETVKGGYDLVTAKELKGWIDQKKEMLIVDTMPFEASYKKQHVPGALQMEFPIPEMTSIDDKTKDALIKLLGPDKDRVIVFYCGFVKCTRSHNGAMWAKKLGYKNVYRFAGGIKAWDQAGFPIGKVK
jgi:thiosulfate/3-mercaptopyruvate sulfurtransferase